MTSTVANPSRSSECHSAVLPCPAVMVNSVFSETGQTTSTDQSSGIRLMAAKRPQCITTLMESILSPQSVLRLMCGNETRSG